MSSPRRRGPIIRGRRSSKDVGLFLSRNHAVWVPAFAGTTSMEKACTPCALHAKRAHTPCDASSSQASFVWLDVGGRTSFMTKSLSNLTGLLPSTPLTTCRFVGLSIKAELALVMGFRDQPYFRLV